MNECIDKLHGCSEAAMCTNTKGSFSCHCEPGYSGNGTYCIGNSFFIISMTCCYNLLHLVTVIKDLKFSDQVRIIYRVSKSDTLKQSQRNLKPFQFISALL